MLDSEEIVDKDSCYIVSLSTRTLIYKGMLSSLQLRHYFKGPPEPLFHERDCPRAFPLLHQYLPHLAIGSAFPPDRTQWRNQYHPWQPFRMQTREAVISPDNLGEMKHIGQVIQPGMSDSASFDNALEFFVRSGMSLPHARYARAGKLQRP